MRYCGTTDHRPQATGHRPQRVNTSSKKVQLMRVAGQKGPGRTRQGSKRQHRTLSSAVCLLNLLPNQVRWQ